MMITPELVAKYKALGLELSRRLDGYARDLVEGVCSHGVGHPIPESVAELDQYGSASRKGTWAIHGCDGCCQGFTWEKEQ